MTDPDASGSRNDSYENAPAEMILGLHKADLIHRCAPELPLDPLSWLR